MSQLLTARAPSLPTHAVTPGRAHLGPSRTVREAGLAGAAVAGAGGRLLSDSGARQVVQPGLFDDVIGAVGPSLLGMASSALTGDGAAVADQARQTGAAVAPGLVEKGVGALGSSIGGPVGGAVSSLGGAAGQGVGSVISGAASPAEALGGLGQAAQPALLQLLMSLLSR